MSELSLHEVAVTIKIYRLLESVCKEWGVSIAEVEKALPESAEVVQGNNLRSVVKMALNQSRLKEVARETDLPAAVYLSLEQAFAHDTSASTSLREDRPLTKEEFKQRAGARVQMNLFDAPEAIVMSRPQTMDLYEDEIGYPRG